MMAMYRYHGDLGFALGGVLLRFGRIPIQAFAFFYAHSDRASQRLGDDFPADTAILCDQAIVCDL